MHRLFIRSLCAALVLMSLMPAAAGAQSLTLELGKTMQMTQLTSGAAASSGAQSSEQTVTLYPDAYSSRAGQTENIYDFGKKTFTVVNHGAQVYTVYPLHSVAIFRSRDRLNRLGMKINLYQQSAGGTTLPISVLTEDIDIDMMLSGSSNNKTAGKIKAQKDGDKTTYTDGKTLTLASATAGSNTVPQPLRKTFAKFFVYEFSLHPEIKKQLGTQANIFKSLEFTNRDMFRNLAVTYTWTLKSVAASDAAAPQISEDYKRIYHADAEIDAAFKAALTPYVFDAAAFQEQTAALIDKRQYLSAFLKAQEARLSMTVSELAAQQNTFNAAVKAAQNFEKGTYLSIVQTPDNDAELKQYVSFLENAKTRAEEMAWLLDFYISSRTREALLKKQQLGKADTEKLAQARQQILATLKKLPHHLPIYQQMAETHFSALEVPTAMLYWSHIAEIDPSAPIAKSLAAMKAETEKDFPEYF
ncbi:MAG: hypothetical protein Q8K65_06905 [Alphaproteobacteria bacterium]|nr:hypothetical protein [Alphaproteobacteria bacterium]